MSTTVTKLANANQNVSVTTAWATQTSAYSKTDSQASATNAPAKSESNTISFGFPAFTTGDIPDDATIVSVNLRVNFKSSVTTSTGAVLGIQGDENGTAQGSESTQGMNTSFASVLKDITATTTIADLRTANFVRARIRSNRSTSNNAITWSVDYVELEVVWDKPTLDQKSFGFYADGTESGASTLASQDANYTYDPAGGDLVIGLRLRLQTTNAIGGVATDNYSLMVSKNGGAYVAAGDILDKNLETNWSGSGVDTSPMTLNDPHGQSVHGMNGYISKLVAYVRSRIATTFSMAATVWAHSGTFGTSSVHSGSALATGNGKNYNANDAVMKLYDFPFNPANRMQLVSGTDYVVGLLASSGPSSIDLMDWAYSLHSGGDHPGNVDASGFASSGEDYCFYLFGSAQNYVWPFESTNLTDGNATTNRLGAGTGSFSAGEIANFGVVFGYAVVASNYTELLFSLQLVAANVSAADTLDFKVYKNGVAIDTYTKVPRITVAGAAAPPPPSRVYPQFIVF